MSELDLVVIGTGSSGSSAALRCANAGWKVAIADVRPYGGTCQLRGCDPKKVLVGAAELVDWAECMRGSGIAGDTRIDWGELMRFKRSFTEPVPAEREGDLRKAGVVTYHGAARFVDPATLAVGNERLQPRRVVLATGARPATLHVSGEEHLIDSTGFLDLERLPKRIAFIGGGYIAFEFAHLALRAGAAPVIFQRGPRVLNGFDPGLVDQLLDLSRQLGIDVRTNATVSAIEKNAAGFVVRGTADGSEFAVACDLAVHAAGRVADVDDLGLDAANVERTKKGIAVNEFLQSPSNPAVYAVGDCADGGGLPLTPTAYVEGDTAARNLLEGNRHTVDFTGIASIVYTIPALGMAGLTEEDARARGVRVAVRAGDTTQWYSSRRIRARRSAYRILVDEERGTIVGAHVLGPHVEELINVLGLAVRAQIPVATIEGVLFGYPTASSEISAMLESS